MNRATLITIQCAWCRRVKVDGSYTGLGLTLLVHEIDLTGRSGKRVHYEVSHGVCPPCKERVLGHSLAA